MGHLRSNISITETQLKTPLLLMAPDSEIPAPGYPVEVLEIVERFLWKEHLKVVLSSSNEVLAFAVFVFKI